jgi:hypothetical protein
MSNAPSRPERRSSSTPTRRPRGPKIISRPKPEPVRTSRISRAPGEVVGEDMRVFTQAKLDLIVRQRVEETRAKYAPRAALADQLVDALAAETAYARVLERQFVNLGATPLPRPVRSTETS